MNIAAAHAYDMSISIASIITFIFLLVLMSRAAGQDHKMKKLYGTMLISGIIANVVYMFNIGLDMQSSVSRALLMLFIMLVFNVIYSGAMYQYMLRYLEYKGVPLARKQIRIYWTAFIIMMIASYVEIVMSGVTDFINEDSLLYILLGWAPTIIYNIYVYRYILQRRAKLEKAAVRGWAYVYFLPVVLIIIVNGLIPHIDTTMLTFLFFTPLLYLAVQAQDANRVTMKLMNEEISLQKLLIEGLAQEYDSVWYMNPQTRAVKVIGGNPEDATGKSMIDEINQMTPKEIYQYLATHNVAVPEDRERVAREMDPDYLKANVKEGESYKINYEFMGVDGERHYMQATVVRRDDQEGMAHLALGLRVVDDIVTAEQKKQEEHQRQLAEALSMAEAASRAKSAFLSNMSHDIRTPMNAIIGFSTIAATHVDEPQLMTEYLSKITTASRHLLSLINDVLDMSRIESGRVKLDKKHNHLPDLMHTIRSVVQSGINAKQLEFFMDCAGVEHENIICDDLRINQVLLNCMSNAIKYTNSGGTVALKVLEKPSSMEGWADFVFKIRDTGIGMSPEFAEHVFDSFTREETATVSKIEGTGLGMAITKNIVEMMNGHISVKSEKGKGTEFTIEIPMEISQKEEPKRDASSLQGLTALIADDDIETCKSVVNMLDGIGMRGEWSTSGRDAVERAKFAYSRNEAYNAYIIDWLMPDLNGLEVVRRIRNEIGDETPIYILTAYDWADIQTEAMEAGVTAILEKPIFQSELINILLDAQEGIQAEYKSNADAELLEAEGDSLTGNKILIAEDIAVNREILKALLEQTGLEFEEAEDGEVAYNKLVQAEEGSFDMVLMDIQMPIMDGLEATRKIRSAGKGWLEELPIIAMTANAFKEDRETALEAGMNDFLTKPVEIPELLAVLTEYMK